MARFKSAADASAAAAAHAADTADHAADTAVHAAATARAAAASARAASATARAASAATRCTAAAVVRNPCPASTEPEEDTEIDVELGTLESSSTFPSSSSTSSSPSSSSSSSTLQNFKETFAWLRSWSGIIYELVLTAFMGVPVYPSYNNIRKKPEPPFMMFFIIYCCIWICISTDLVLLFLGRSKKEKSLSLWMYRIYMMGLCISMVLYIYMLIPHNSGINLGAGILIAFVVLAHMTAWNIRLTYKRDPSSTSRPTET